MNHTSIEEEIFESPSVDSVGNSEQKLSSHKEALIDRPAGLNNADIVETRLNADTAFGVFNGKVFHANQVEYYSLADAIERRAESPLQRLARLRGELDELKSDLDCMVDSEGKTAGSMSMWETLQNEASKLSISASSLESHKAFELLQTSKSSHERALSGLVDSLKDIKITESESELTNSSKFESSHVVLLEQRLHRLETLLGSTGNLGDVSSATGSSSGSVALGGGKSCPYPLLDAVRRLEERVTLLGLGELETLRAKCEAVRNELDTTLKSKSALSAEAKVAEATRQLAGLLAVVDKVDAVAADLPVLVLRLKTLEQVPTDRLLVVIILAVLNN